MTTFAKCALGAGIALSMTLSAASAQMMGGGHKRQADTAKNEAGKPKTDQKIYVQTTGSLADKSYDPWRTLR